MPTPLKVKLGDLIHVIDQTSGEPLLTIEIDGTGKNSARLCFEVPDHVRVEREKCADRVDPGPEVVPMIGVDVADSDSAMIVEQTSPQPRTTARESEASE